MNKLQYIDYVKEKSLDGVAYPELFKELDPELFKQFPFDEPIPVKERKCSNRGDSKYLVLVHSDLVKLDFTSAYLAKQKLIDYDIRLSDDGKEVTYSGLGNFTKPFNYQQIAARFIKDLPELIKLFDRTCSTHLRGLSIHKRHANKRENYKFTEVEGGFAINGRAIVTATAYQGKIVIGIRPHIRNEHVMTEVHNTIMQLLKMTKLSLVDAKYISLTQESLIFCELSTDTFPSISLATRTLQEKVVDINLRIAKLVQERDSHQEALDGLDKFKQLYKQGVLNEI